MRGAVVPATKAPSALRSMTTQTHNRPVELKALTGLRFFAALAVLAFHFATHGGAGLPEILRTIMGRGDTGVNFFFVLSGVVLAYSYASRQSDNRSFWIARVARIYPLYIIAMLLGLPQFLARAGAMERAPAGIVALSEVVMLQAWAPWALDGLNNAGWSLSVEAFFYVLFPWLLPVLARWTVRQLLTRAGAIWIVAVLAQAALLAWQNNSSDAAAQYAIGAFAAFSPIANLPNFIIGMATGLIFIKSDAASAASPLRATLLEAGLVLAVLGALAAAFVPTHLLRTGLIAPVFAALMFVFARGRGLLSKLVSTAPMLLLGNASYALYLVQGHTYVYLQQTVLKLVPAGSLLSMGIAFGAILAVSILSYYFIETPARRAIVNALKGASKPRIAPR